MELILHRVNKINDLKKLDKKFGVEIDLRIYGGKIVLNHEPYQDGDSFDEYLSEYNHGTLVLNIKETGIEEEVLKKVRKKGIFWIALIANSLSRYRLAAIWFSRSSNEFIHTAAGNF